MVAAGAVDSRVPSVSLPEAAYRVRKIDRIVECVPNFSEGRERSVLAAIAHSIGSVPEVVLLEVDAGVATNRTVVTFVGSPRGVKEAAFQAIRTASQLIDMRHHSGAHPRLGATDVCPFIPVRDVTMEECVTIAREVGERVANELDIPVFLYEFAAATTDRRDLPAIRKGEYEGLEEKLKDPRWSPDFGRPKFNARSGATLIGARNFLVAYNVNLDTLDRRTAQDIALTVRKPSRLKACRAIGWVIDEYEKAQVSMNLTDYRVTPLHVAFETVKTEARKRNIPVTGSELVGLVPLEAMVMTGLYYLNREKRSTAASETELIRVATESLGLNDVAEFVPSEKILDHRIRNIPNPLLRRNISP